MNNRSNEPSAGSGPFYVGMDAGSVSLNCMVVDSRGRIVKTYPYIRHLGQVERSVGELVDQLTRSFDSRHIAALAFTGNHGRDLSRRLGFFYEFETISQVLGTLHVAPGVRSIISMGGQDTALFQVGHRDDGTWELELYNANGPCASGTGSFIDQQAQRLATAIYSRETDFSQIRIERILTDFIRLGQQSREAAAVACRCTVFTKSDMIHLQNKGERLEDIIYGLHVGNARNYMSTLVADRDLPEPIVFIGGLTQNPLQVKAFQNYFSHIRIPPHPTATGALGVALQARAENRREGLDVDRIREVLADHRRRSVPTAPRLELKHTSFGHHANIALRPQGVPIRAYLGIDIGSTTTKLALIDTEGRIIHKQYVPTQGKPVAVTQDLLRGLKTDLGRRVEILAVATTGSGRHVVGDFLNVELIIDEITAHARGAVAVDADVDTIFEIGGQDAKYIAIANTHPLDFDMNKVCAAGTGSFLHELANKYGVNIVGEFQDLALSSVTPVRLAERCTVFMESDLVSYHQQSVPLNDLMAGLCYAVVHNYLNRVVAKRPVGRRVMFLGGPSLNKAVVAAFEIILGQAMLVPPHREVLGAFGAAISAQEQMQEGIIQGQTFRGLESAVNDQRHFTERVCRVDHHCHNQCKLKIYDFDGRRSIWGGECGRYEVNRLQGERRPDYFHLREEIWQRHLAGLAAELPSEGPLWEVSGRPTVGMQRALYTPQTGILWAHFFDHLGLRLVLTPSTDNAIVQDGIESMAAETCFPIKVSHGHLHHLAGRTRYLFLPSLIDMPTPQEAEAGLFCPLVQGNGYMLRQALDLPSESLLTPVVHLRYDLDRLALEISGQIRHRLGVSHVRVREALTVGIEKQRAFEAALYQRGREILGGLAADETVVVVSGRPYNLYDERLNLKLGRNLGRIGLTALPMDFFDTRGVSLSDFPSMYWGLGARILRTAKLIRSRTHYFGLHLTNFSCGADSFLEHFYKYILGDRPCLILELDEHSAVAGVMTRLEAYKNVITNIRATERRPAAALKLAKR